MPKALRLCFRDVEMEILEWMEYFFGVGRGCGRHSAQAFWPRITLRCQGLNLGWPWVQSPRVWPPAPLNPRGAHFSKLPSPVLSAISWEWTSVRIPEPAHGSGHIRAEAICHPTPRVSVFSYFGNSRQYKYFKCLHNCAAVKWDSAGRSSGFAVFSGSRAGFRSTGVCLTHGSTPRPPVFMLGQSVRSFCCRMAGFKAGLFP